jgi:hypothetical protein
VTGIVLLLVVLFPLTARAQTDDYWPISNTSVFARNSDGDLIVYRNAGQGFLAENATTVAAATFALAGPPRPLAALQADQNGVYARADVFGRTSAGELVHYWWTKAGDWQAENLTTLPTLVVSCGAVLCPPGTRGPTFVGEPEVGMSSGGGYDPRFDVFARNSAGQLIHYWWSSVAPSGWRAENLTTKPGLAVFPVGLPAPAIAGRPDVVVSNQNGYLRHDVFARNTFGQLVHYWWSAAPPSGWHAENLTTLPTLAVFPANAPIPTFQGDPEAVWSTQGGYLRHDVFGRNSAGQLVHYWWSAAGPGGWHAENLTTLPQLVVFPAGRPRPTLSSAPDVVVSTQNGYLRHDVFARNNASELVHYWWSAAPPSGWKAENLTARLNGPTIAGPPSAAANVVGSGLRFDVFAPGTSGGVIQYGWTAGPGWDHEDLAMVTGGPAVHSALDTPGDISYTGHEVFGRSDAFFSAPGHLVRYSATSATNWQAQSLTADLSGPTIAGDPVVMKPWPFGMWSQ